MRLILAADRVALHAARIGGCLQQAVLAGYGADPAERPISNHLDLVATLPELLNHLVTEPRLDLDLPRLAFARIERAREMVRVEVRRVDRLLQVQPAIDVLEEDVQGPLVLVVAAGRAEGEVGVAAAKGERRRQRGARPFAGLERVRQAVLEPEHLRARPEREAELGDDR